MEFTDIHAHLLFGVDDGAKDEATMRAMLDAAYQDGVRTLCATPHFQPDFYGDNLKARDEAFLRLSAYAEEILSTAKMHKEQTDDMSVLICRVEIA